jgi:hypothetical protein
MQHARPRSSTALSPVTSLAGLFYGLGLVALVLLGISGTIYKMVADDGVIADVFGKSPSTGFFAVGAFIAICTGAWLTGIGSTHRQRLWVSNLVVYGSALAGAVYLLRYWWTGTF